MINPEISSSTPLETPVGKSQSELGWLLAGTILPCFSARFYLEAAKRKTSRAVWFFILFGLACGTLAALGVMRGMLSVGDGIRNAYAQGKIPEITIQNGVALVKGPQPAVLLDEERAAFIVDTTGSIQRLDPARYDYGFLLTRTSLQIVNRQGQNQTIPLSEINQALQSNTIVIGADAVTRLWSQFSAVFVILVWVGGVIWDAFVRLGYLALLALLVAGVFRLFQPRAGYAPVFVVGAYAYIPALYLSILLNQVQIHFFAMQTLIWLVLWLIALTLAVRESRNPEVKGEFSLGSWRTWIGIPMVAGFALNTVFSWGSQPWIVWVLAVGTLLVLIIVDLIRMLQPESSGSV